MIRPILVTGGIGQLGTSLCGLPVPEGYELVAPGLDIPGLGTVRALAAACADQAIERLPEPAA